MTLQKEGFDVILICAGVKSKIVNKIKIEGIPRYNNRIKHFLFSSVYYVIKSSIKCKAFVYQIHDPELIFSGIILRILGKKVIYDIHEDNSSSLLSKPYLENRLFANLISKFFFRVEIFAANFFSKIITARPDISKKFVRFRPTTINNFPIVHNTRRKKPKTHSNNFIVIYVGGLSQIRGIKEVIQSLKYTDQVELWLLGPWKDKSFQKECERLEGWNKTRYLGVVKPDQIYDFLDQADIGIITFKAVPNHIKTLATKPFEYMISGLPVIMSDFKYWRSFFGDIGTYVNPEEPHEIAKAINYLKSNPHRIKKISNEGSKLVREKLNWQNESRKLIEIYSMFN